VIPPPVMAPPGAAGGVLPGIPGIPGLGGDVAPPAFVQQQQAAEAAAARARAAAADPFGASAAPAAAAPQQLVIQLDGKDVADSEVGRTKTGSIVAVALTGVIALGAGYGIGGMVETKNQERQTISAVNGIRQEIVRLGDVINQMKQHVDHAAEVGNITVMREGDEGGGQQAAPTHPPELDPSLIEWFRSQPSDPPFTADVYAGRVGRLRSVVVSKLTLVTLQFTQAWQLLGQHAQRTNTASVTAALNAANPQSAERSPMLVSFGRANPTAPPFAILVSIAGPPGPDGRIGIAGPGIAPGQMRTPYADGPIAPDQLTNLAFPVAPGQGLAASYVSAAVGPWRQYQQRISELKQLIDGLAQNQTQLLDALQGRSGG
jgi:hypothetical protein